MEDLSLDFEALSREEILGKLKQLGCNATTKSNTSNLKTKLRNIAKIHHPFHDFLGQMTQ